MSVTVSERAIREEGHNGSVRVSPVAQNSGVRWIAPRKDAPAMVRVTWFCGDSMVFAVPAIRTTIEHLVTLADTGAWLEVEDYDASRQNVMVRNGRLVIEGAGTPRGVDFGDLRRAIKLTIKGMK